MILTYESLGSQKLKAALKVTSSFGNVKRKVGPTFEKLENVKSAVKKAR